jgi:hypothetical protein
LQDKGKSHKFTPGGKKNCTIKTHSIVKIFRHESFTEIYVQAAVQDVVEQIDNSICILEQSMGARNRVGIGLPYRPARLHRLAESECLKIDSWASLKFKNTVSEIFLPSLSVYPLPVWQVEALSIIASRVQGGATSSDTRQARSSLLILVPWM